MAGYVLTEKGIQKLQQRKETIKKTQEQIALCVNLHRATVSKVFQGEKPLNRSSILRLFQGLELPLDESDYKPIYGVIAKRMKLKMTDIDRLRVTAQKLRALADNAEERGNLQEASTLRRQAEELEDIASRAEEAESDDD